MDENSRKTTISIFSFIVGLIFAIDGFMNIMGVAMPVEIISLKVHPLGFFYVVSVGELIGGILLLVENARFYGAFLAWLTTIVGIIYGATGPDLFVSGFANAAFPHYVVNSVVGLAGTIAKTSLLGAVIENDPFMQSCA